MILTNEDRAALVQVQLLVAGILKHAAMSEIEEEHEREFAKKIENESGTLPLSDRDFKGFLKFTEKEILQMPKKLRIVIKELNCTVYARKRNTGKYLCSYEIRFNRGGYKISASGRTKEQARQLFIEKAKLAEEQKNQSAATVPKNFNDFALYWFENFHKRKVCEETYKKSVTRYETYVKPVFGESNIKDIYSIAIQKLLDSISDRHRLEEDTFSMLNQIFNCAVKHGLINLNPVGMVFHQNGVREHGKRIEKNEEIKLLNAYQGTPFQIIFAVMHYTGLRPCEYITAVIDGNFIIARNSKRKNGKEEFKRIPVTPMLRPYLNGITTLPQVNMKTLDKRFKAVLPNHKLYDMRTTFQTRCSECGIPDNVIGVWMGNSIGKLKDAYTDFSDEYLLNEAKKFEY